MDRFVGMESYFLAALPVALLVTAIFYMGHRKSCSLGALVLTQLFSFITVLLLITVLGLYGILPDTAVLIFFILAVLFYGVGGATLAGLTMEAKAHEAREQLVREELKNSSREEGDK